ncbi:hypothetical protein GCM10009558_090400 [Virgisporangium aurantiacum]
MCTSTRSISAGGGWAGGAAGGGCGPAIVMPTLGGSVPLHHVAEILGAPTVALPIANNDNNQHAPNENLRLGNLWYGVDLFATLLTTEMESDR